MQVCVVGIPDDKGELGYIGDKKIKMLSTAKKALDYAQGI